MRAPRRRNLCICTTTAAKTAVAGTSNDNPYQFQGREAEPMNGLFGGMYYYRARFLDTGLSRFVSRDPAGFQGGGHLYNYGGNAPTMSSDPTGMEASGWPSGFGLNSKVPYGDVGGLKAMALSAEGAGFSQPSGTDTNGGENAGAEGGQWGSGNNLAGMGMDGGDGRPPGASGDSGLAYRAQIQAAENIGFASEVFVITADPFLMALEAAAEVEPSDILATHAAIVGVGVVDMMAEGTLANALAQSLPPPGLQTVSPIGTAAP